MRKTAGQGSRRVFGALSGIGALVGGLPGQQVVEVYRAPESTTVRTVDMRCRGIAATADGTLFVVVIEDRKGEGLERRSLRLLASRTKGLKWETCDAWAVGPTAEASLVADPTRPLVHVVYTTRVGEIPALSLAHRVFDAETSAWTGPPEIVRAAKSADDQFQVADVETDAEGALLVTAQGFMQKDKELGRYPAVVFLRRPGQAWQGPLRVNRSEEGASPLIVWTASRTLIAYLGRGRTGLPAPSFRSLDLTRFTLGTDERRLTSVGAPTLDPENPNQREVLGRVMDRPPLIPQRFACVADVRGEVQILQLLVMPFGGEFRLTTGPDLAEPIHRFVDRDHMPELRGEQFQHFGLVRGPGAELFAIYSKVADAHATLWWRQLGEGPASEPRLLANDAEGAFAQINPYRSGHFDCTLLAVAAGPSTLAPGGRIVAVGVVPARVTRAVPTKK